MEQKLHTPEGVRQVQDKECRTKLTVQEKLHQVLHLYGHQDIQFPHLNILRCSERKSEPISSRELIF